MELKEGETIKLLETREVLFEKFVGEELSKRIEMKNFFYKKLNGCEIMFLKKYTDYIFFIKKDECLFEIY